MAINASMYRDIGNENSRQILRVDPTRPVQAAWGMSLPAYRHPPAARALAPSLKQRGEESKSRKRKIEKAKLEMRNGGDR
jgi:hypothetical protein